MLTVRRVRLAFRLWRRGFGLRYAISEARQGVDIKLCSDWEGWT